MANRALLPRVALALITPALAFHANAQSLVSAPAPDACAKLSGLFIPPKAIGLPTSGAVVMSTAQVAADANDNPNGDYCAVKGVIVPVSAAAPNMEFQVNLPATWNAKAVQLGGGGYDGVLITGLGPAGLQPADVANPLKQGFVTLGSDGGHKGRSPFDGAFGLNDEALLNYGKQSVKKVHDVAMAIVTAHYGMAPRRFYFIGNSQGGHEALDAAARYGADYDGVVANYPAYNITMLHLASLDIGKAVYANGGASWFSPAKTKLLTDAVMKACDGLDGVQDGIISNVAGCNAAFNVKTIETQLRCPAGADTGDTCFSDAQIAAVARISSPYRPGVTLSGRDAFPRWALLEGARYEGRSTFGKSPVPANPPSESEILVYSAGAATVKYIITRKPEFDAMTFEPKDWQARLQELTGIMDATDVDLTPFRARGGKMILLHGTTDDFISPHNTVDYYQRHLALQGQTNMDAMMRFYLIPGLSHGFGVFNAKYDGLAALDAWVEKGQAPRGLVATDGNPGSTRSRPMCVYPAWPRYNGSGPEEAAESFTCVQ